MKRASPFVSAPTNTQTDTSGSLDPASKEVYLINHRTMPAPTFAKLVA